MKLNLKEAIAFDDKNQNNVMNGNVDVSIDYAVCYTTINILMK